MCSEIIFDKLNFSDRSSLLFFTNYVINLPRIPNEHIFISCS